MSIIASLRNTFENYNDQKPAQIKASMENAILAINDASITANLKNSLDNFNEQSQAQIKASIESTLWAIDHPTDVFGDNLDSVINDLFVSHPDVAA